MVDKNTKIGDIVTYGENQYKVTDNRITKGKDKKKAFIAINVIAILLIPATFILYIVSLIITGINSQSFEFGISDTLIRFGIFLVSFLVFIVVHEYVHYLTYRYLGKTPKDKLKFGVVLKSGMAYCISLVPNTIKASRLSLMMPFYVLVVPIIIIAIILQNGFLMLLAAMFASGSGGDIWYMWTLRKDSKDKYIIEAMPEGDGYEIGYVVMEKIDSETI